MIRVDILHFDGCPNVAPTADRVRAVAAGLGIEIDLRFLRVETVEDAIRERFLGSPSVRANGVDIDAFAWDRSDFGLSCRMYGGAGVPPDAMIAAALTGSSRSGRSSRLATAGSLVAAALSSACCWLPLILVTAGLSAGGIAVAFASLRPWLIGIAVASLAFGVWSNERRPRTSDACGCATAPHRRRRLNRVMLAISALGVVAFTLFPQYVDRVFGARGAVNSSSAREITLRVDGMTCTGCETGIEAALRRVPGVALADANYEHGAVVVGLAPDAVIGADALIQAIAAAGYTARSAETVPSRKPADAPTTSLRVLSDDLEPLVEHFNAASDRRQFLAILSPT